MKRSLKQSFKESEYKSILRETISVIESARNNAATAIITCTNEMHWMVGKLLYERKLESTHGEGIVKRLEWTLNVPIQNLACLLVIYGI